MPRTIYFVAVGLLAVGSAFAQVEDDQKDSEFVLLNKYRESVRSGKWDETVEVYEQLRGFPAFSDLTVQYLYALAQYNLGKLKPAEQMRQLGATLKHLHVSHL